MSWKTTIIRHVFRGKVLLQKHSPTILTVAGIGLGIGATVSAGIASTKIGEIQAQHTANMNKIAKDAEIAERFPDEGYVYTDNQQAADKQTVYLLTTGSYIRLYAPTFILTALSAVSLLSAHHILSKRYAGVTAALAAVTQKFTDYREHVKNQYGAEVDNDFYHDIETVETTNEQGQIEQKKVKKVSSNANVAFFDEYSKYWDHYNPDMNAVMLRNVIKQANDRLALDGHLFLNDVYRLLGYNDTPEGSVIGWVLDKDDPIKVVDLGVFNGTDDPWDFENDIPWDGKVGIDLHFNTDGVIYDRI